MDSDVDTGLDTRAEKMRHTGNRPIGVQVPFNK
jgi:hypothetical protein